MLRRRMMMDKGSVNQLLYIEGVDGAYINTNFIPTENTKIVAEVKFINTAGFYSFGSLEGFSGNYKRWHFGVLNGNLQIDYNNKDMITRTNDEEFHIFTISKNRVSIDDNPKITSGIVTNKGTIPLYIFDRNNLLSTTQKYGSAQVKYFDIYENNELVRHYIPSYYNGVYCMYETVENKYYYNQGEGYFIGDVDNN